MHRIKNVLVNGIHRKSGLFTERGDFIRKRGKGISHLSTSTSIIIQNISCKIDCVTSIMLTECFAQSVDTSASMPTVSLPTTVIIERIKCTSKKILRIFYHTFAPFNISNDNFFQKTVYSFFKICYYILRIIPLEAI